MLNEKLDIFEEKAPEILNNLAKHIETELTERKKMTPLEAKQFGVDIAMRISKAWAGEVIYIPRALLFKLSMRDLQIWHEYNGKNIRDLVRKYNVSIQWAYQIVKKMQKAEIDKRQIKLFD